MNMNMNMNPLNTLCPPQPSSPIPAGTGMLEALRAQIQSQEQRLLLVEHLAMGASRSIERVLSQHENMTKMLSALCSRIDTIDENTNNRNNASSAPPTTVTTAADVGEDKSSVEVIAADERQMRKTDEKAEEGGRTGSQDDHGPAIATMAVDALSLLKDDGGRMRFRTVS